MTLKSAASYGSGGLGIELIVMEGGSVITEKTVNSGSVVVGSRLGVLLVTCLRTRPVEEGRIHKRVHHGTASGTVFPGISVLAAHTDDEFTSL